MRNQELLKVISDLNAYRELYLNVIEREAFVNKTIQIITDKLNDAQPSINLYMEPPAGISLSCEEAKQIVKCLSWIDNILINKIGSKELL